MDSDELSIPYNLQRQHKCMTIGEVKHLNLLITEMKATLNIQILVWRVFFVHV